MIRIATAALLHTHNQYLVNASQKPYATGHGLVVLARRQEHSALDLFPAIQQLFAEAVTLKNPLVKAQVMVVLMAGLDNADDTATPGYYASECAKNLVDFKGDYPTREAFWKSMFYGSCQSMSCERYLVGGVRELHGQAEAWLFKRGLRG